MKVKVVWDSATKPTLYDGEASRVVFDGFIIEQDAGGYVVHSRSSESISIEIIQSNAIRIKRRE